MNTRSQEINSFHKGEGRRSERINVIEIITFDHDVISHSQMNDLESELDGKII